MGKPYGFGLDWWGFGILIYEMLVGLPPFSSENKNELHKQIINKKPNFKHMGRDINISSDAKDLILQLLMKDDKDRIKPNEIKSHPWFSNIYFDDVYNGKIGSLFIPKIVYYIKLEKL
jgi:serine/threonine protein kinase